MRQPLMAGREYKLVPADQIELDSENPRIAKWVEMYGDNLAAEQMALALVARRYGSSYA